MNQELSDKFVLLKVSDCFKIFKLVGWSLTVFDALKELHSMCDGCAELIKVQLSNMPFILPMCYGVW